VKLGAEISTDLQTNFVLTALFEMAQLQTGHSGKV
jgi:hypothetical protein